MIIWIKIFKESFNTIGVQQEMDWLDYEVGSISLTFGVNQWNPYGNIQPQGGSIKMIHSLHICFSFAQKC